MSTQPFPGFDWDIEKDRLNRKRHGFGFDLAAFVFMDTNALDYESRWDEGEPRFSILGLVLGQILYVSHAERDDGALTRIISARKATRRERDAYFAR